jgi:ABC-type antimicrobial peptide transport system ATPase subunit
VAVVEARDLKRTYHTTTGVFRRRAMDVEAVRGVSFEIDPERCSACSDRTAPARRRRSRC